MPSVRLTALLGLFTALLAGCSTGSVHPPPSAALSESATAGFKHQAGWQPLSALTPPAAGPWWQSFGDAELDRLMQAANTANLDVAQAAARDRQARALWRQAGAA
ncbi:MAG: hypothetical protein WAQ08_09130, partial [Aquabacterium sp.]